MLRVTIGMMPAHGGVSTTAVIDFIESVRLELATTDPEDLVETLDHLSCRLESQATCSAACANALLPYAEKHLLSQSRTRRQPCIARLTAISRAGGTLNNFQRDRALAVVTLHWTKDIVEYYHFAELGRPTLIAMQKVAAKYPQWTQAVHRINAAMLSRHVEHILQPKRSNWRIGDHAGATKKLGIAGQGHPIDRTDLDLVSKWAESGVIVLEGEEMRNADHEASTEVREYVARWTTLSELPSDIRNAAKTSTCNHNRCFSLKLDPNGLLIPSQIAGTKRGAIDSCQSSEKKRRTNLVQDGLSLVTPSTPPSDSEYQQHGNGVLAQDPNEGSSETAISSIHASGSEEHHLVDAGPLNSTPVPDLARSMDSSAECYHNSETGQAHQDRHALSPGTERLIPEDQDAEYVEDSETGLPSPGQGFRPVSTLASRRQVGGLGKVYTNKQQFSGKRPGLRPIVPPISILSPVSSLFMPRNNSSISPSVGSLRSQTSSPACSSPRIATSPLSDLTGLDGTIEETRTTLFPQSQNTDLVRSQTCSPFSSVPRAATSPLTGIQEHGGLIVASRTALSSRSPSTGLAGSQTADPSFSSLRTSTSPLQDLQDGLIEVTRTELLPQMHDDDHFHEANASATATECFPGGSGTSPSAVLSPFGPNAIDQHLSIPSIEYPQARELSTRATPVGTEVVLDPLFDNFEDVQARLFSPEPSHISMQIDSEVPDRKVELLLARDRIADLARSHCIKLDAWAATIQLADTHYGLTMPQDEGIRRTEVDRVSYATLEGYVSGAANTIVSKPTIITGPFSSPQEHGQEWRASARDFTGAQIQVSGDTWVRSLHGTQLCMIVPETETEDAGSSRFSPVGHSRAIFLDRGDILWMPRHIPYAAITLNPGTMQAGKVWNAALPISLPEQSPGMLTVDKFMEALHLILCISELHY